MSPTGLVTAIDVSSNQGPSIRALLTQLRPQHVVVKLYQSIERPGGELAGWQYSAVHAQQAREFGSSVGGYGWLYGDMSGELQALEFLSTARKASIQFTQTNPLWLDCEDYKNAQGVVSYPSLATISQAIAACERLAIPVGIYTGGWWWRRVTGNSALFANHPLWDANYNDPPSLSNPGYGGWALRSAHQYTGSPVDRSIFSAAVASA